MSHTFKPIAAGLENQFALIQQQATAQAALTAKICAALPAPENLHIVGAYYKAETLVITASSAAWCARVRFFQDRLHTHLTALGEASFTKLHVRVSKSRFPTISNKLSQRRAD